MNWRFVKRLAISVKHRHAATNSKEIDKRLCQQRQCDVSVCLLRKMWRLLYVNNPACGCGLLSGNWPGGPRGGQALTDSLISWHMPSSSYWHYDIFISLLLLAFASIMANVIPFFFFQNRTDKVQLNHVIRCVL